MVCLARFERATHSLEGCCSIHLSYRHMTDFRNSGNSGLFLFKHRGEPI